MTFNQYWSSVFADVHLASLNQRWVVLETLQKVLAQMPKSVSVFTIGYSSEKRPIEMLQVGTGSKSVLAWSCMHGNETTAMRGWLDLFMNIEKPETEHHFQKLLAVYTIYYIPMLNPDGAERYTRRNAMGIDMNRDARALQTPEMQILLAQIDSYKPEIAFNLHDQRAIFHVGTKPATISFLAPSVDVERTITAPRKKTMHYIGKAAQDLLPIINGGIGRYTDEYYPTAIGELVQQRGITTILIECGSSFNDLLRQEARKMAPIILHSILEASLRNDTPETTAYQHIMLNENRQVDLLIKNMQMVLCDRTVQLDIALMAEACVQEGVYKNIFKIHDIGDLQNTIGLQTHQWKATKSMGSIKIGALASLEIETDLGILNLLEGIHF